MGTHSPGIRSPDLILPDYCFCDYLQCVAYKEIPGNVDDLKQNIKDVCSNIPSYVLVNTLNYDQ